MDPYNVEIISSDLKNDRFRRQIARSLARVSNGQTVNEIVKSVTRNHRKASRTEVSRFIRKTVSDEISRQNGVFISSSDGIVDLRARSDLRRSVLSNLQDQGLCASGSGSPSKQEMDSKDHLRRCHAMARASKYSSMTDFLAEKEPVLLESFADGHEVDVDSFSPTLRVVNAGSPEGDLFRYASLLWSVPVSEGFGRRVKFLVFDKSNNKLVGLFALGDPVFNLRCRDQWVGWNAEQRKARLYNVMDVFVLGAVPPYNQLLAGKLVAMIASSTKVRRIVERKYRGTRTVITGEVKDPRLVLLTTGSALGKSSLYDRIKFRDEVVYQRIGMTNGWGHFQFNGRLFQDMVDFVSIGDPKLAHANRFGNGPNWKFRVTRKCLERIGLNKDIQQHGIAREIYAIPLARNCCEYLRGDEDKPVFIDRPFDEVCDFFVQRWMIGRSERVPSYRDHSRKDVSAAIHSAGEASWRK